MPELSAPVDSSTGLSNARRKLLIGALVAATVAAPLTVALVDAFGPTSADIQRASRAFGPAKEILAFLSQRSPGERTVAELSKLRRIAAVSAPKQRALGKIRQPLLPPSVVKSLSNDVPLGIVLPVLPALSIPTPALDALVLPANAVILPSAAPLIGGLPGVGGPGGGVPIDPPIISPPPVISPVPEPQTWLTMLLGFVFVGANVRRNRAAKFRLRNV